MPSPRVDQRDGWLLLALTDADVVARPLCGTGHVIPLHRRVAVPTSLIAIDGTLWDAVRLAWGGEASMSTPGDGSLVFPVFARADKLVLLAGFEAFLELPASCTSVEVYRVEIDEADEVTQYAIVFSMPPHPDEATT